MLSNAWKVDKDNILLDVSHSNHSNCCDMRENLKGNPDSVLGTNMVSETKVGSNNVQNEKTETESLIDEMMVVKVNQTFITNNRTARKKKQKTYAQTATENVEKTADQNVLCLNKELQLGSGEKKLLI